MIAAIVILFGDGYFCLFRLDIECDRLLLTATAIVLNWKLFILNWKQFDKRVACLIRRNWLWDRRFMTLFLRLLSYHFLGYFDWLLILNILIIGG